MTERPPAAAEAARIGAAGYALRGLFALVLVGAMVVLFVVLSGESDAGRRAITAYLRSVASGAAVSPAVGGAEAGELTSVLGRARGFSIDNFQGQADTACFWVDLAVDGASVEARFVLSGDGDAQTVTAASLRRECECPVDFERACALR